jgi:hypothetical protein
MDVEVAEALDDDRTVIRRLLQLYHYDFSEFDGSDLNLHGEYLHRYFDEYWTDPDRRAFLFRVEGALAGFALVFTGEPHTRRKRTEKVRTKPLIGRKAWFGPRRWGWGLSPVTAEGWAVLATGIGVALALAATVRHFRWLSLIALAVMLVVIFLKGTSPGGPEEWSEFRATRDGHRRS